MYTIPTMNILLCKACWIAVVFILYLDSCVFTYWINEQSKSCSDQVIYLSQYEIEFCIINAMYYFFHILINYHNPYSFDRQICPAVCRQVSTILISMPNTSFHEMVAECPT